MSNPREHQGLGRTKIGRRGGEKGTGTNGGEGLVKGGNIASAVINDSNRLYQGETNLRIE
ncbi:MAG: hypothetical protein ACK587_13955 [Cyanobacteriota bacterium]